MANICLLRAQKLALDTLGSRRTQWPIALLRWLKKKGLRARSVANGVFAPLFGGSFCAVCGKKSLMGLSGPFPKILIREWKLSPQWAAWFEEREEVYCIACHASNRYRHFASVIVGHYCRELSVPIASFDELTRLPAFQALDVAEINSLEILHKFLVRLPKLKFSEYASNGPAVPHEDLMALSYPDETFDAVFTSETLEHVPDINRALSEIRRVLKPGGVHIFTVPVVWDRPKTLQRARVEEGKLVHLYPPSYHGDPAARAQDYLVFFEFGADVVEIVRKVQFEVQVFQDKKNPALITLLTRK